MALVCLGGYYVNTEQVAYFYHTEGKLTIALVAVSADQWIVLPDPEACQSALLQKAFEADRRYMT